MDPIGQEDLSPLFDALGAWLNGWLTAHDLSEIDAEVRAVLTGTGAAQKGGLWSDMPELFILSGRS